MFSYFLLGPNPEKPISDATSGSSISPLPVALRFLSFLFSLL